MNIPTLLALLTLLVALPLNLYVTVRLWQLHRAKPDIEVIRERGIASTAVTIIVAVFAVIFLNNDLPAPFIGGNDTKLITRIAVLLMSVGPALYWLRLYSRK